MAYCVFSSAYLRNMTQSDFNLSKRYPSQPSPPKKKNNQRCSLLQKVHPSHLHPPRTDLLTLSSLAGPTRHIHRVQGACFPRIILAPAAVKERYDTHVQTAAKLQARCGSCRKLAEWGWTRFAGGLGVRPWQAASCAIAPNGLRKQVQFSFPKSFVFALK